tara:strand:- start:1081 stop:2868 length:1788 start_codon:yes stop_codon:yes gene_type:complete
MKKIYLIYIARSLLLSLCPISLFAQPIIWEKIINSSNEVDFDKKINWEIYDNFIEHGYKESEINNNLNKAENNIKKHKKDYNLIDLGLTVPTAHTISEGAIKFYVDQVFPSKIGEEEGSGNQNYSGFANYGLKENMMLSLFFSHSDDPLHKKINNINSQPNNLWFSYGGSLRWKLFEKNKFKLAIDNSIESWIVKSGGCNGYGCSGNSSNIFNNGIKAVRNENLVSSFSTPFTWKIIDKTELTFSPKITFLPQEQGNSFGSGEFYGINTGLGIGISYKPNLRFSGFNSIYLPLSGNNSFDENLKFKKAFIYTSGFNFALDAKTAFEGYITNSFGSTPSTSILTLPSENTLIIGSRFIYTPLAKNKTKATIIDYKKNHLVNGLSISNSNLINEGKKLIDFNIDTNGSNWTTLISGLSSSFNFEVAYGKSSKISELKNKYASTFIEPSTANIRVGGKAILFSKGNERKIKTGIRLSFGRSFGETWPGYLFSEITNSLWINDKIIFNLNPKSAWTGEGNPFSLGTGIVWKLNKYIYIIPESNIAISDSQNNWTLAIRAIPKENIYLDLYTTSAYNFTDIGELIQAKGQSIGIKTALLF